MDKPVDRLFNSVVRHLEYALAVVLIAAVVFTFVSSLRGIIQLDWSDTDTFYDVIRRSLALVIGLEFVRMLITHKLNVVLELLAFVVARKLLLPNLTASDIVLSIIAFVILMIARHFMFRDDVLAEKEEQN